MAEKLETLPFSLNLEDLSLTPTKLTSGNFQAESVRLLEVGLPGGPPCSLFAGHHERDRRRMMAEAFHEGGDRESYLLHTEGLRPRRRGSGSPLDVQRYG